MFIPIIILICSISIIFGSYLRTGEFVQKGVTLKGGSIVTVQLSQTVNVDQVQEALRKLTTADLSVEELSSSGTQLGIIVETTVQDVEFIKKFLNDNYSVRTITVESVGPSLGQSFFKQAIIAVVVAFLMMALVVFIYFRIPAPSLYIVVCAAADILFAWAMVVLLNIKLSTAGVAALLMLIGYSVDTDILLTTRVMRGTHGTTTERMWGAMSTGSTMTLAAMAATGISYLFTPSEVLKQIMTILFFGLIADLINTWTLNTGLLKLYVDRKKEPQNG